MDEALQGLMQIRRCRGSCKSGAAKADENKPLQTLMQLMRCKARGIASCEALREHQREASISGFSIQVGGIGRQAFELRMHHRFCQREHTSSPECERERASEQGSEQSE